ncbi:L,D-transpeptidase family protein [Rhodoblastus acidophilus]|uniref:L,D-transpeptidase family protein n=1 Tax=Rhodoblastus acidophilus TaxID=1074 RepID=A0A6N8DSC0_RHOAC|nr:L,D-transpeptidase family protein [Rhodoblastus acidophilus]MTV32081.1 L,D-transpeptidase family protein [Rhodoblastus acidophilus]
MRVGHWMGLLTLAALAVPLEAPAQVAEPSPLSPAPTIQTPPAAPASPAPASPAPAPAAPTSPAPDASAPAAAPSDPGATPAPAASATPAPKKPKPKPPAPPREMALSDDPTPVLQPETFFATALASERYAAIADAGGWPTVSALSPGAKGAAVATLRKRLALEGDLVGAEANGTNWSPALTAGVKRFQFRNGLRQTGVVAGATLRALNVPARTRFKQLASSANRLAGLSFPFGDKYVVVNLPSTAVDAVEYGHVAHRYVAIVGGPDHHSPQIAAKIVAVNLNPTWTVPESIIKNEIIPKMQRQPNYLSRARIRILNNRGQEVNPGSINWNSEQAKNYTLRQDSGAGNSLGLIRIAMPNPDAVYMHDTPSRNLFANDYRFLSHGCVRVQGVYDLAAWLLRETPAPNGGVWTGQLIQDRIATGAREDVKLTAPIPVIWVYMTGWASAEGTVHFRDDVYNFDTVGD